MKTSVSLVSAVLAVAAALGSGSTLSHPRSTAPAQSVIVQAIDSARAASAVRSVGGQVTHELPIIDAVGARMTAAQLEMLQRLPGIRRVYADREVKTAGKAYSTFYPTLVRADRLHAEGIMGTGVTVAVVDTGLYAGSAGDGAVTQNVYGQNRVLHRYDAIYGLTFPNAIYPADGYGHGTHITSVIASSKQSGSLYNGVAPNVNLMVVTAFDNTGVGTYANVIRAIDHVVQYRAQYDVRVMNLSFSAPPRSHYWDDPLNQAVMKAWQAGIVVVTSAGNTGPAAMTIGVPGNVPYVVTVGAMTDHYTPTQLDDDYLASFSATGPTMEGFVKPEVVSPGGHLVGLMDTQSLLAQTHPAYKNQGSYFTMSGTSQAAAVTSAVAALVLQAHPELTPDDVKCRLMASARPAVDAVGNRAYSVFQQGAGLVDAYAAVHGSAGGCANLGLDVNGDLAGTAHYGGPAAQTGDGTYYLSGLQGDGYTWDGAYSWSSGSVWPDSMPSDSAVWSTADTYSSGSVWPDSMPSGSAIWTAGLIDPVATNKWVDQQ